MPSEFQWIEINFAPLRPTGFGNFHRAGQSLLFAGWGGAGRASLMARFLCILTIKYKSHYKSIKEEYTSEIFFVVCSAKRYDNILLSIAYM